MYAGRSALITLFSVSSRCASSIAVADVAEQLVVVDRAGLAASTQSTSVVYITASGRPNSVSIHS